MRFLRFFINGAIKLAIRVGCRINTEEFSKIPLKGPYIFVTNHSTFLEGPLLYLFMRPRRTYAMGKAELWNNKFTGFLMNLWEVIPIKRGSADMEGMKRCFDVLKGGDFLCLAPEGTRSGTGILQKGKPGMVMFAQKAGVPLLPVAHWGGEKLFSNLKRFKRTDFTLRVGTPLKIHLPEGEESQGNIRQAIADEVMIEIAKLLPKEYHGVYKGRTIDPPLYLKPISQED